MTAEPCGPVREEEVDLKLDALLEFLGNVESDVKDLRRRVSDLELLRLMAPLGVGAHYPG